MSSPIRPLLRRPRDVRMHNLPRAIIRFEVQKMYFVDPRTRWFARQNNFWRIGFWRDDRTNNRAVISSACYAYQKESGETNSSWTAQ